MHISAGQSKCNFVLLAAAAGNSVDGNAWLHNQGINTASYTDLPDEGKA